MALSARATIFFWVLLLGTIIGPGNLAMAYEGKAKETVDAVLSAYGGKVALARIRTISAAGRIDDFLRKTSGGYSRAMRRPGELRIDIMPEQGGEVRILSKGQGWQGRGENLGVANQISLSSMRYQYGYLDLPMSLAEETVKISHGGIKELHGRPMELLLVKLEAAPELRAYIDLSTHLIRRIEADFDMGAMGRSLLGTEYEEFREVDGVLFPHRLVNYAGDGRISVISIQRLTINQPLPAQTFLSTERR